MGATDEAEWAVWEAEDHRLCELTGANRLNEAIGGIHKEINGVLSEFLDIPVTSGRIAKNVGEALPSLALTAGIRKSIEQSIKELQALQAR
jgi:hypothetical protein